MTKGPCAGIFKEAFECVHYASDDNLRSECRPKMESMAECVSEHRDQYRSYAGMLDELKAQHANN
jgi:hypothetical protein